MSKQRGQQQTRRHTRQRRNASQGYGWAVLSCVLLVALLSFIVIVIIYWQLIALYVYIVLGLLGMIGLVWLGLRLYPRYLDIQMRREELISTRAHTALARESLNTLRGSGDANINIKYSHEGRVEALSVIRDQLHATARQQSQIIEQLHARIEELEQPQGQLLLSSSARADENATTQSLEPQIPTAPKFSEMSHLIRPDRLPLCWTVDGPQYGTIHDLLSMGITGKPGRGKTTALMYYVCMLLRAGAEVHVWDPHGAMDDLRRLNGHSLHGMPATAKVVYLDRKDDIVDSVRDLQQLLNERDDYYRAAHRTKHPLLLLADELPVLAEWDSEQRNGMTMIDLIKRFVLEARKWNGYFIGSGQSFDAKILPRNISDNFASRIIFFSSAMRARMAGLEKEAIDCLLPLLRRAGPGVMIFDCSRWDEVVIGAIPLISMDDMMSYLGVSADDQAVPVTEHVPIIGTTRETAQERSGTRTEVSERDDSAELKMLLDQVGKMKQSGMSNSAILKEFGLNAGGRNNVNLSVLFSLPDKSN